MSDFYQETAAGIQLFIRVTPKASHDRLGPVHEGRLKVAVTTAPEKGKATAHVVKLLAKKLGLPKTAIQVVIGGTDRDKTLLVQGLSAAALCEKLGA